MSSSPRAVLAGRELPVVTAAAADRGTQAARAVRNAISVDVEDYFHVAAFAHKIKPADWSSMEYRTEANTHRLLELFDQFETKATFFVLGWVAEHSPGLVRAIHAAGHEVACHGMSHQLIYRQTPEVFERETRDSKHLLEDIIGAGVDGYRAASWSITKQSIWALDIIREAGFSYDSSVFPIHHDRYGIPGASQHPGHVETPSGHRLVEFPPSTASIWGIRLPVAGGGYFRLLPYWLTSFGLRRINEREDQPFVFYLHPWEIDVDQPRVEAGWLSTFRHYVNLAETEPRLRRLLAEFDCTTVRSALSDLGLLGDAAAHA